MFQARQLAYQVKTVAARGLCIEPDHELTGNQVFDTSRGRSEELHAGQHLGGLGCRHENHVAAQET